MSTADAIEYWAGFLLVVTFGCAVGRYIGRALGSALIRLFEATGRALATGRAEARLR